MRSIKRIIGTWALDALLWATPKHHVRTLVALNLLVKASLADLEDDKEHQPA